MSDPLAHIDAVRRSAGLMTLTEILALAERGNTVFDPYSLLIGAQAVIGSGNVFHPGASLLCAAGAALSLGDRNVLHGGTLLDAAGGSIRVGNGNLFGPGGFSARAGNGETLTIGQDGCYRGGADVSGTSRLGDGSQIFGAIQAHGITLEDGAPWASPAPDERGGLLQGVGTARGLTVPKGYAIFGMGLFSDRTLTRQSRFLDGP